MKWFAYLAVLFSVSVSAAAEPGDNPTKFQIIPQQEQPSLWDNWRIASMTIQSSGSGEKASYPTGDARRPFSAVITEKTISLWVGTRKFAEMPYRIDPKQTPPAIDATFQDQKMQGIYQLTAEKLMIRLNAEATGRPKDIAAKDAEIAMDLTRHHGSTICVMDADGSNLRYVAPLFEYTFQGSPMWSNDGKQIAFDTWREVLGEGLTDVHIVVTDSKGKNLKDLGAGAMPSWSPDGKKIAYSKYSPHGVYVMNADGSDEQLIDAEGWCARWSPIKDEVLYTVYEDGGANLCVKDMKTGDQRILLDPKYRTIYWGLSWSPDGQWICFKGDDSDVAVVHAEGQKKGFKVLISSEDSRVKKVSSYFGWSPDSKRILALMQMEDSKLYLMYLLDREGKTPPKLLAGQDMHRFCGGSSWSLDGKKILGEAKSAQPAPAEKEEPEKNE